MRTKVFNVFTLVLLAVLCVLFLVVYLPKLFGMDCYYVETDSMVPALKVGSVVIDKKVSFEEIEVNDMITFSDEAYLKFCTHRVVEINSEDKSFVTKGDNNNIRDPFITEYKYVRGKVVFAVPYLGYLFKALDTTAARISAVAAAVVFICVEIEFFKKNKKEGGNND